MSQVNTEIGRNATKRNLVLLLAVVVMFGFRLLPATGALGSEAMAVLGIFFASLIMWMGISIDWPCFITLLMIGFLPSYGFGKTFSGAFGNSTVAFLIFTFMLVYPLSKTNFVRRCTVAFITNGIARKGPWHFMCFLWAAVAFMGLFISPSVLFVAFMPFLEDIFQVLGLKKGSKTANCMMMGTAFAISLSSGMTPIGHVWPTLAMGYYASATGVEVNLFQYMAMGIPTGILILAVMVLIFRFLVDPKDTADIDPSKAISLRGTVPAADRKEKIVLGTMGLTVFLWIVPSLVKGVLPEFYATVNSWTTAMPPMVGCLILFILTDNGKSIMNFAETSKNVMWGSVLMTAAATQLGSCLTNNDIGISTWLSDVLAPVANALPATGLVLFFIAWAVLETNFSSNIVTTTVVSSIALAVTLALPAGTVSVPAIVCLIGFGAGVCNMTPAGQSTVNTVAIASGWTDSKSMFIWGGVFALAAILIMSFVGYPIGSVVM